MISTGGLCDVHQLKINTHVWHVLQDVLRLRHLLQPRTHEGWPQRVICKKTGTTDKDQINSYVIPVFLKPSQ